MGSSSASVCAFHVSDLRSGMRARRCLDKVGSDAAASTLPAADHAADAYVATNAHATSALSPLRNVKASVLRPVGLVLGRNPAVPNVGCAWPIFGFDNRESLLIVFL